MSFLYYYQKSDALSGRVSVCVLGYFLKSAGSKRIRGYYFTFWGSTVTG